jgi:preprotein translocase subunit SecD
MADLALIINMLFLLSCMAYFGSTLTLPGLAGIVLSMAMAVDANVLIFERIKEELRAGKPIRIALDSGYAKAATTIIDSNVTTIIAAILLFQFGTGPIKGFAVTLTLGNLITIFTSTWINRLMHQTWIANPQVNTLSI